MENAELNQEEQAVPETPDPEKAARIAEQAQRIANQRKQMRLMQFLQQRPTPQFVWGLPLFNRAQTIERFAQIRKTHEKLKDLSDDQLVHADVSGNMTIVSNYTRRFERTIGMQFGVGIGISPEDNVTQHGPNAIVTLKNKYESPYLYLYSRTWENFKYPEKIKELEAKRAEAEQRLTERFGELTDMGLVSADGKLDTQRYLHAVAEIGIRAYAAQQAAEAEANAAQEEVVEDAEPVMQQIETKPQNTGVAASL